MEREEARLLLSCYHPEDQPSADMVEALRVALQDPELGAWLMQEQHQNALFSEAILQWKIPESLRSEIVAHGEPLERTDWDDLMASAMADIPLPENGAARVVAAMRQTQATSPQKPAIWRKMAWISTAAAGVAAGIFLTPHAGKPDEPLANQRTERRVDSVTVARGMTQIRSEFVQTVAAQQFSMQARESTPAVMLDQLRENGMPAPHCCSCLPKRLRQISGAGTGEIFLEGKKGSILAFRDGDQVVHLAVFARADFPDLVQPSAKGGSEREIQNDAQWSTALWSDDQSVYFMIGRSENVAGVSLDAYF